MKCKNIECNKETINNDKYCSYTCRNIYINKYLRDYSKVKETFRKKRELKEAEYYKNPKLCKTCKTVIPFNEKIKNFCNHSCAATLTNQNKKGKSKKISLQGLENIKNHNQSIEHRQKVSDGLKKYYRQQGYETINRKYKNFISEENYSENPKKCFICLKDLSYKKKGNKTCSK